MAVKKNYFRVLIYYANYRMKLVLERPYGRIWSLLMSSINM